MHAAWQSEPKQETDRVEKCNTNMDSISKLRDNTTKPIVKTRSSKITEYFLSGLAYDSDQKKCWIYTTNNKDFDDVFNGIGCFEGTFSLQLKPYSKPYQAPLRHVAYPLQNHSRRSYKGYKSRTS